MALHSTMKTLGADNGANLNHSQSSSYKGFSRVRSFIPALIKIL